ncbi:MAG: GNAT family N-acetyltransferase [Acidimicrobiia bacterium]|nr:GNAT family N-acetyltransferase [Acidimicrobiia bacterium]
MAAFRPGTRPRVWLQPRWEYMHAHPLVEGLDLSRVGVAEDHRHIVGVVHPEHDPAFCHLQAHPGTAAVKEGLVDWAMSKCGGESAAFGGEVIGIWVPEPDPGLEAILRDRGFAATDAREFMAVRSLAPRLPKVALPEGYRLSTLADENDLHQVNRVLWRGFEHEGPPPDDEIPGRVRVQRSPHFRRDLHVVAIAPSGEYAAYAGVWIDPVNRVAMVEPVATDPDHRRRGLASAAIVEGLRRAHAEGVTEAWVGADLPVYTSLGFTVIGHDTLWVKPRG